jgi:hypothetical protein
MCEKKTLKIFTISYESMYGNLTDLWTSSNLDHPATFATLAMNLEILRGLWIGRSITRRKNEKWREDGECDARRKEGKNEEGV